MKARLSANLALSFLMVLASAACAAPVPNTPTAPPTGPFPQAASAASSPAPTQDTGRLTARMLTAPNALAGPGPSSFNWSPVGAALAYVGQQEGQDVLWLYDAATGNQQVLLNPAKSPGNIDVTSAQWSPQGDRLLLAGDTALWLLDVKTGGLNTGRERQRQDRADVHTRRHAPIFRAGQ
jgi:dipeptidyl aminopeptidase/acylaminoacyl peptidase